MPDQAPQAPSLNQVVPFHIHNGSDSPNVSYVNLNDTPTILTDTSIVALYKIFTTTDDMAVNDAVSITTTPGSVTDSGAGSNNLNCWGFIGFTKTATAGGGPTFDVVVQTSGVVSGFTGLTTGSIYYLANAAGTISLTPGTYKYKVGIAVSTTQLFILGPNSKEFNDLATDTLSYINANFMLPGVVASNTLQKSADTERNGTDGGYVLVKEIKVYMSGVVRVKEDLKGLTTYGKVYINGIAVGAEHYPNNNNYQTYSEDFTVGAGDKIQLYCYTPIPGYSWFARNFRIYYDYGKLATETVVDID